MFWADPPADEGLAVMEPTLFARRAILGLIVSGTATLVTRAGAAPALPPIVVFHDPTCGCCRKWVAHLTANGFAVTLNDAPSMKAVKDRLGVPADLSSCHTGEIGGYVIEGHVPADAVKRLLADKPEARGLAVPGMPAGSPGMEGGEPETYDVMLFGAGEPRVFGRFRADKAV
jgi:hypothetical protein